ncbi:MAG TPA: TetR/AcrR family transcriptional regulator [Mycobacteriales bacterium]|nr:TetR/AcrR family transcriptional regulator [Mycobacteriales bacterium]
MASEAATERALRKHASAESVERGRVRRAQIVEAATQLFSQTGYRGTGLAGIAAEVGVTQAGLLHHFGSKERLLQAVVQHRSEQDNPLIERIIGDGGIGMFDRLELLAEHNVERPGLSQLFTVLVAENLMADDPVHEFFVDRYRALREAICAAMVSGQQRGEIRRDVDLDAVSRRIVAALDGLQIQWLLDPERVDLVAEYRALGVALRRELEAAT